MIVVFSLISRYFPSLDTDFVTPYESIVASGTSTKNFYENTNDNEVTPSTSTLTIPPFQRKLPILPVLLIGFIQILAAAFVIILEIFVFDIGVGLWCGFVYGFAGSAALILGKRRLFLLENFRMFRFFSFQSSRYGSRTLSNINSFDDSIRW